MQRFFIDPHHIHGDRVTLSAYHAHQIHHVLRMRVGESIMVLDNTGQEYHVELTDIAPKQAHGIITQRQMSRAELPIAITLYMALLKRDNFEWVLQKATELGVAQVVPMVTARTIVKPTSGQKQDRWQRILTEAAEQSRRGRVPGLHAPLSFSDALTACPSESLNLIPWEEESARTFASTLPNMPAHVSLWIGPEGGFTPDEIEAAQGRGLLPVTFGRRILRAETAAIYGCSVLAHTATD